MPRRQQQPYPADEFGFYYFQRNRFAANILAAHCQLAVQCRNTTISSIMVNFEHVNTNKNTALWWFGTVCNFCTQVLQTITTRNRNTCWPTSSQMILTNNCNKQKLHNPHHSGDITDLRSQISLPLSVPWASAVAASAVLYAAATIMHRCYDQLNYKALHCPNICSKCRNLNLSTYRQWCSMAIRAPCCWHFDKGILPLTLKPLLYLFTHRASLPCSLSELTRSNEKKVAHRQTHQRLLLVNLDWLPAYLTIESHSFAFLNQTEPFKNLGGNHKFENWDKERATNASRPFSKCSPMEPLVGETLKAEAGEVIVMLGAPSGHQRSNSTPSGCSAGHRHSGQQIESTLWPHKPNCSK